MARIQHNGRFAQVGHAFQAARMIHQPARHPAKMVLAIAHMIPVVFFAQNGQAAVFFHFMGRLIGQARAVAQVQVAHGRGHRVMLGKHMYISFLKLNKIISRGELLSAHNSPIVSRINFAGSRSRSSTPDASWPASPAPQVRLLAPISPTSPMGKIGLATSGS
ncbi:hypothetical protein AP95_2825 [Staphylococcus aureus Lyso 2 2010]|nr:hypothetical protein AP95_2825 [Staphylococcus aureus Lyso 2 2010]